MKERAEIFTKIKGFEDWDKSKSQNPKGFKEPLGFPSILKILNSRVLKPYCYFMDSIGLYFSRYAYARKRFTANIIRPVTIPGVLCMVNS